MRKLLSLLFSLALAVSAEAQGLSSSMFPGPGTPHGAGGPSITFSNAVGLGSNGGSGNFSAGYTGSVLTHGLLVVCIWGDYSDNVSGGTYAGAALTLGGKIQVIAGDRWVYLFYLLNPASGANTLSLTSSTGYVIVTVGEYASVKQSGQPDGSATSTTSTVNPSTPITITNAGSWAMGCAKGGSLASGTNSTLRALDGAFNGGGLFDSAGGLSSGTYNMNITTNTNSALVINSFQPG